MLNGASEVGFEAEAGQQVGGRDKAANLRRLTRLAQRDYDIMGQNHLCCQWTSKGGTWKIYGKARQRWTNDAHALPALPVKRWEMGDYGGVEGKKLKDFLGFIE